MSGHSKWASIKHKKGAVDAKRGKLFSKLAAPFRSRRATAAATPTGNPRWRSRSRRRATPACPRTTSSGRSKGHRRATRRGGFEEVVYEGYGPGGVAMLFEALTDNRNRTGAEVRHAFTKRGGNLGEPGSVAWTFEKKGELVLDGARYGEDDLIAAIDAGAEDVSLDGDVWEVVTAPTDLAAVRDALEAEGLELESAELVMGPTTRTPVEEPRSRTLMRLIEELEEHDDVQAVHANYDVDAEVLERVAAA